MNVEVELQKEEVIAEVHIDMNDIVMEQEDDVM